MTHTALLGSAAAKALHQIFEVATADRSGVASIVGVIRLTATQRIW
jgi:hypothetical protein